MKFNLSKIFACPRCQTPLQVKSPQGKCPQCKFSYRKKAGVWNFFYTPRARSLKSQKEYDRTHQKHFGRPSDGSYEILASFARGNRTVDIACGEGFIEQLSPETVAVEFSMEALKKAKKKGARYLVLADAHSLPFKDNAFDISISAGNLEHFESPQKAISQMARVSKIQVLTVHQYPPVPLGSLIHEALTKILGIRHQPIEKPISSWNLERMIKKAGLHIVFKGVWTLPVNYGRVIKFLPEFKNLPSCSFVISIKK